MIICPVANATARWLFYFETMLPNILINISFNKSFPF